MMAVIDTHGALPDEACPVYHAEDLLHRQDSARIVLGDQIYVLRKTRAGKLILTK